MDINEIKNSTLAKLTSKEIGVLGLCNYGVGLYRGELKTRYNGMPRKTEDGITFTYTAKNGYRIEFTELPTDEDVREWAARIWDENRGRYNEFPMGIVGCDFFR